MEKESREEQGSCGESCGERLSGGGGGGAGARVVPLQTQRFRQRGGALLAAFGTLKRSWARGTLQGARREHLLGSDSQLGLPGFSQLLCDCRAVSGEVLLKNVGERPTSCKRELLPSVPAGRRPAAAARRAQRLYRYPSFAKHVLQASHTNLDQHHPRVV